MIIGVLWPSAIRCFICCKHLRIEDQIDETTATAECRRSSSAREKFRSHEYSELPAMRSFISPYFAPQPDFLTDQILGLAKISLMVRVTSLRSKSRFSSCLTIQSIFPSISAAPQSSVSRVHASSQHQAFSTGDEVVAPGSCQVPLVYGS
jgi:hypothetical protein